MTWCSALILGHDQSRRARVLPALLDRLDIVAAALSALVRTDQAGPAPPSAPSWPRRTDAGQDDSSQRAPFVAAARKVWNNRARPAMSAAAPLTTAYEDELAVPAAASLPRPRLPKSIGC